MGIKHPYLLVSDENFSLYVFYSVFFNNMCQFSMFSNMMPFPSIDSAHLASSPFSPTPSGMKRASGKYYLQTFAFSFAAMITKPCGSSGDTLCKICLVESDVCCVYVKLTKKLILT